MLKSNYEVEILVNGHPVREYLHEGKIYIEGKEDTNFNIRIKNNGWEKILAIPSIDGLSVVSGKEASYDSRGYIISGHDAVKVEGWRTSDKEVAQFYFTNPSSSYANKKGKAGNLGVVGVAIFTEVIPEKHFIDWDFPSFPNWKYVEPYRPYKNPIDWDFNTTGTHESTRSFCMSAQLHDSSLDSKTVTSSSLGTGFGETKRNEIIRKSFARKNTPETIFEIFYNTRRELEKIGVEFNRPQYITPNAFPKNGYCEPPTN